MDVSLPHDCDHTIAKSGKYWFSRSPDSFPGPLCIDRSSEIMIN